MRSNIWEALKLYSTSFPRVKNDFPISVTQFEWYSNYKGEARTIGVEEPVGEYSKIWLEKGNVKWTVKWISLLVFCNQFCWLNGTLKGNTFFIISIIQMELELMWLTLTTDEFISLTDKFETIQICGMFLGYIVLFHFAIHMA